MDLEENVIKSDTFQYLLNATKELLQNNDFNIEENREALEKIDRCIKKDKFMNHKRLIF
tara:strand:+ start:520 stop:696 length:177 start_codon:yes stop_codon:yes gene_type:complete